MLFIIVSCSSFHFNYVYIFGGKKKEGKLKEIIEVSSSLFYKIENREVIKLRDPKAEISVLLSYRVISSRTETYNTIKIRRGLPWWRSGWESACQCRGHRFEPWSGKIPHASEQLGPCATTAEPAL